MAKNVKAAKVKVKKKATTPVNSEVVKTEVTTATPKPEGPKKRKKNAGDKPQPAWLFPPDEENPVLNPKIKTDAQIQKETEERLDAIKFIKHRATGAPAKPQPPPQLLQLVAAFLGSFGFNSSGRLFNIERQARVKTTGWEDAIGAKFEKGQPDLLMIYKDWYNNVWKSRIKEDEETSSSDSEDSISEGNDATVDISEDSDDSSDGSDAPKSKKTAKAQTNGKTKVKAKTKTSSASSSSSSTSDSDADDENDVAAPASSISKPTLGSLVSNLKRKEGATIKEAKKIEKEPVKKRKKSSDEKQPIKADGAVEASDSSSESSSESSSDSEFSGGVPAVSKPVSLSVNTKNNGSDSSNTLVVSPQKKEASSSTSDSDSCSNSSSNSSKSDDFDAKPTKATKISVTETTKRKRASSPKEISTPASTKKAKKTSTPFQRIPSDVVVNPKLASNKYVPYDYAEKAHQDLIVTKGKGFTKEKNKKKRGSYRGGQIDVGGGKGIKFDD